jgi:hypothetical protein
VVVIVVERVSLVAVVVGRVCLIVVDCFVEWVGRFVV